MKYGGVSERTLALSGKRYLETEHSIEIADGARDRFPHVQKRVLQEALYRYTIAHAQFRRERIASPEARPARWHSSVGNSEGMKFPHAIVAAASF